MKRKSHDSIEILFGIILCAFIRIGRERECQVVGVQCKNNDMNREKKEGLLLTTC